MAEQVTCPEIKDVLSQNECLENFGGLGVNVYVFIKSDLAAPLEPEAGKNTYATLFFHMNSYQTIHYLIKKLMLIFP